MNAGKKEGLDVGVNVTLLREGEPIIHPMTGEVLGVPQEPVGMATVFEVGETMSRASLEKVYSVPMLNDLAEFMVEIEMPAVAEMVPQAEVDEMSARINKLERSMRWYQKKDKAMSGYPAFVEQVWDEIIAMKSYLVSVDERLVDLEEPAGSRSNPPIIRDER